MKNNNKNRKISPCIGLNNFNENTNFLYSLRDKPLIMNEGLVVENGDLVICYKKEAFYFAIITSEFNGMAISKDITKIGNVKTKDIPKYWAALQFGSRNQVCRELLDSPPDQVLPQLEAFIGNFWKKMKNKVPVYEYIYYLYRTAHYKENEVFYNKLELIQSNILSSKRLNPLKIRIITQMLSRELIGQHMIAKTTLFFCDEKSDFQLTERKEITTSSKLPELLKEVLNYRTFIFCCELISKPEAIKLLKILVSLNCRLIIYGKRKSQLEHLKKLIADGQTLDSSFFILEKEFNIKKLSRLANFEEDRRLHIQNLLKLHMQLEITDFKHIDKNILDKETFINFNKAVTQVLIYYLGKFTDIIPSNLLYTDYGKQRLKFNNFKEMDHIFSNLYGAGKTNQKELWGRFMLLRGGEAKGNNFRRLIKKNAVYIKDLQTHFPNLYKYLIEHEL